MHCYYPLVYHPFSAGCFAKPDVFLYFPFPFFCLRHCPPPPGRRRGQCGGPAGGATGRGPAGAPRRGGAGGAAGRAARQGAAAPGGRAARGGGRAALRAEAGGSGAARRPGRGGGP